jgi:prenylated cyclic peptide (anacyclamide/piricyclamide family)
LEKQTMTKKNLKPQQAAPVQREINTASSVGGTGLTPHITGKGCFVDKSFDGTGLTGKWNPFAGDDAE